MMKNCLKQAQIICLVIKFIDFILKKDKIYYPKIFLTEYKYIEKEKKMIRSITDYLEIFSDDFWQRID